MTILGNTGAAALWLSIAAGACVPTAALAADTTASAPRRASVSFAGATLALPLPAGFCAVPRSGAGEPFYRMQDSANKGTNVVALLFVECGEWARIEKGDAGRMHHFGSYLLQMMGGKEQLAPASYARADYAKGVYGVELSSADIETDVNARMKEASSVPLELGGTKITNLAYDGSAAYFSMVSRVSIPGEAAVLCAVSGATLVRRVPITVNIYDDFNGPESITKLLDQQKSNIAALLAANPDAPAAKR